MNIDKSLLNKNFHLKELTVKDKQVQIYDNCLPSDEFKKIQDLLLGTAFPWFYNSSVVYNDDKITPPIDGFDNDDVQQFVHGFYQSTDMSWSGMTDALSPILNILYPRAWMRVKANLGLKEIQHLVGGWHRDVLNPWTGEVHVQESMIGILYINTNNGYTLLETGDKIESVENRLLLFPCHIMHTGVTQTDTKIRVVINFNFMSHD